MTRISYANVPEEVMEADRLIVSGCRMLLHFSYYDEVSDEDQAKLLSFVRGLKKELDRLREMYPPEILG